MSTIPTITIVPPNSNRADDWNAAVREGAEKAGVELTETGAVKPAKKEDERTIYEASLTVNGKEVVFRDSDAAVVLQQYTAAVTAAQLSAPAPAPAAKVEPKPAFTEAEMFDISMGLMKGDVKVLDTYIEKSGVLDRYLASKGLNVEELKQTTQKSQSNKVFNEWQQATQGFIHKLKAGVIDYPGGEQNMTLTGH